jgi:hypothetical protein
MGRIEVGFTNLGCSAVPVELGTLSLGRSGWKPASPNDHATPFKREEPIEWNQPEQRENEMRVEGQIWSQGGVDG